MSNILNQIKWKHDFDGKATTSEENLFQGLFFDGNIIEACLLNITIKEILQFHGQDIQFNECNLNVIKKAV
ncbi:hypothetical protein V1477_013840 [Vespula maculifrons]|uniref:Uncharacterized protein n=1 Tax=Vespula maculifrons TaxID=7453 RepID=A0ABD2BPF2_VESMC